MTGCPSHFSGDGFPGMEFKVHAVPPEQFATWAQGARGQGSALDGRGYAELAKPSSYVKPMTYGAVAPGLFDAIVAEPTPPPDPSCRRRHNRPRHGTGGR